MKKITKKDLISLFFDHEESEICHGLRYFMDQLIEDDFNHSIDLYKAKRINGIDQFYCSAFNSPGDKGHCGAECEKYKPRNGKSGICVHNRPLYEATEKVTLLQRGDNFYWR